MKIRTIGLLIIIAGLSLAEHAAAQTKFAVGAQLVDKTGISLKADLNDQVAITGLTSFVISDISSQLTIEANFILKNYPEDLALESGRLYMYYGGGFQATFYENISNRFGFRIPVGLEYELEDNPLGIYLDLAPTIDIEPAVLVYLGSSLGLRYYFD